MTVRDRFGESLQLLKDAVNGNVALDTEYPSLFSSLCRFYSDENNHHVHFWGLDVEEDYTILIDNMIADGVLEAT
jgi:hypothetical protein